MCNAITINKFSQNDKKIVLDLLSKADLPIADLTTKKMRNFMVARDGDNHILGVVGVETYQEIGLLRSLAVDPAYRGKGIGLQLTRRMESFAKHNGIRALYLLTMTAADFFVKIGYKVTHRDKVPDSIGKTEEYKNLCPVSAVCLFKALDSD